MLFRLLRLALGKQLSLGIIPLQPGLPIDRRYDAVVDTAHAGKSDSKKVYASIQAALDAAPDSGKTPYVILVRNGTYREKIVINKPNITFCGEDRAQTILSWNDHSGVKDATGKSIGTWKCATLIVRAPDFRAENLTIENTFDYLGNDIKSPTDPSFTNEPQAVALMTDQGSDRATFLNINLRSYQDTLFVSSGRSYFKQCAIAGNIDFIFGAGQAVIDDCDIITRPRGVDTQGEPVAYITAPSTQLVDKFGIVIINSRLKKESDQVPPHSCPLGRPWHPTTTFPDGRYADPNAIGTATFINCHMEDHVTPAGWDKMAGTGRKAGGKDWFLPGNPLHARFSEYGNSGPGAVAHPLRRQLCPDEARGYSIEKVLNGWNPLIR